eukprot:883634-Prorocentrum_minimum.AAC.2
MSAARFTSMKTSSCRDRDDHSDEGREHIPTGRTNPTRGEGNITSFYGSSCRGRDDQSDEGRGHIPTGRTNPMRGEGNITSFYRPFCANNGKDALNTSETLGERVYTFIPTGRTNQMRGESIYLQGGPIR